MGENKITESSGVVTSGVFKHTSPLASHKTKIKLVILLFLIIAIGITAGLLISHHKKSVANLNLSSNPEAGISQAAASDAKNPKTKVSDLLFSASNYSEDGNYSAGIAAYKEVLEVAPTNQDGLVGIANDYFLLKNGPAAVNYFSQAIKAIQSDSNSPYADEISFYKNIIINARKNDFSYPSQTNDTSSSVKTAGN